MSETHLSLQPDDPAAESPISLIQHPVLTLGQLSPHSAEDRSLALQMLKTASDSAWRLAEKQREQAEAELKKAEGEMRRAEMERTREERK